MAELDVRWEDLLLLSSKDNLENCLLVIIYLILYLGVTFSKLLLLMFSLTREKVRL
jgi:hypothetical protein